ncbi:MAG: ribosome-associated translation inhibitor RaiA [bacterium]|nr:ribosome-associated translation inhibitor RaiA [bacterium]
MKINIKAINLDLTPALNQYIEDKIGSLSKFLKNYEIESEIQARVEVARTTRHHHSGNVFKAEVNLDLPKKILRSVAEKEDIRLAINKVRDELQQEIKKHNQKLNIKNDKKAYREVLRRKGQI